MPDASIIWISGPVLRARAERVFHINEAALVGNQSLLGEVIRIDGDELVLQVYEDTTGLRPGDPVQGTGSPLSVKLGPGLLGNIFDGLLRPLVTEGPYIQPGVQQSHSTQLYKFKATVQVGNHLSPGRVFGVIERPNAQVQRCLAPPDCAGRVISIEPNGEYTEDHPVCVLERDTGDTCEIAMSHAWPVRQPRPVAARIPVEGPLFTGQRILDSMFPLACGGRAAMPGGFGTGKTILQESLAKW